MIQGAHAVQATVIDQTRAKSSFTNVKRRRKQLGAAQERSPPEAERLCGSPTSKCPRDTEKSRREGGCRHPVRARPNGPEAAPAPKAAKKAAAPGRNKRLSAADGADEPQANRGYETRAWQEKLHTRA